MKFRKSVLIFLLGGVISGVFAPESAADTSNSFEDDDTGRILYLTDSVGKLPAGSFLVVDEKTGRSGFECHLLGSTAKYSVRRSAVRPMVFYENSTAFAVTQYALKDFASGKNNTPEIQLARAFGDNTNRINQMAQFDVALNKLKKSLREAQRQRGLQEMDLEEYEDLLAEVLEDNQIFDTVKQAAGSGDWMLAIALNNAYLCNIRLLANVLLPTARTRDLGDKFLQAQTLELISLFAAHITANNLRCQNFRRQFPRARGIWSSPPPTNYKQLMDFFKRSLESYIRLDDISQVVHPQDWGSAMLDVLIMSENVPGTDDLKKEFDEAMRRIENSRQAR